MPRLQLAADGAGDAGDAGGGGGAAAAAGNPALQAGREAFARQRWAVLSPEAWGLGAQRQDFVELCQRTWGEMEPDSTLLHSFCYCTALARSRSLIPAQCSAAVS